MLTNKELIQTIRAEIERRIEAIKGYKIREYDGEVCGLNRLLSFIDYLSDGTSLYDNISVKDGKESWIPKWKPLEDSSYDTHRLPEYDWKLRRLIARDEDGIYYLTMEDLYKLPKDNT